MSSFSSASGLESADSRDFPPTFAALSQPNEFYHYLFDWSPQPLWVYDIETLRYLAVNNAACAHYGYSHEEFLTLTILDIRPSEDIPALKENIAAQRADLNRAGVWRHIKKDGSLIEIEITSHDFVFGGRAARLVMAHDVTEQRVTQRILQSLIEGTSAFGGDDFFPALVKSLAQALDVDIAAVTRWSNDEHTRLQTLAFWQGGALQPNFEYSIFNTPCEKVIKIRNNVFYADAVRADFPDEPLLAFHNIVSYYGTPLLSSTGEVRGHLCVMDTRPLRNKERIEVAFSLFAARMTLEIERMEAESEAARFTALAQNSSDFIAISTLEKKLLFLNEAGRDLVGLAKDFDITTLQAIDFAVEDATDDVTPIFNEILKLGSRRGENSLRHFQSGERIPVEVNSFVLKNAHDDSAFGVATIQRDIREKKASERALQESEERHRSIVQAADEGILVFDMEYIVTFANPRMEKMLGYESGEMVGQSVLQWIFEDELPEVYKCIQRRKQGLADSTEYGLRRMDGARVDVMISGAPMYNVRREVVAVLDMVTDITARKNADRAFREAMRNQNALLNNAPIVFYALDRNGFFTMAAGKGLQALGVTTEQTVGTSALEKYRDLPRVLDSLRRALAGESFTTTEYIGEQAFQTSYHPVYDQAGNFNGTTGIATDITEQKRAESALAEAEGKYRGLFENAIEGIFQTTVDGRYITANPMLACIYGYDSAAELLASVSNIAQQIYIEPGRRDEFVQQMTLHGFVSRFVSLVRRRDGSITWISENAREMRGAQGELLGYEGTTIDISGLKEAEAALRVSDSRMRDIVEHSSNLFYSHTAEHIVTYVSPQSWQFFDCEPDEVIGEWMNLVSDHPINREGFRICQRAIDTGERQPPYRLEMEGRKGRKLWVEVNEAPVVRDGRTVAIVGALVDITKRIEAEQKLQHQTLHDALTGLPNRALFLDRLQHALARSQREDNRHAVLCLDLDRFKVINDSLGHEIGDQLLQEFVARLKKCLRARDTGARLGGDEFVILLEDVEGIHDAIAMADCIAGALKEPFAIEDHQLFVTTSTGIKFIDPKRAPEMKNDDASEVTSTRSPDDESFQHSPVALLQNDDFSADLHLRDAEVAMYRAKSKGRSQYELFDAGMNAHAIERLRIEGDLRRGIERGEMRVFYQPLLRLHDEKVVGFEALVRWQHPKMGLLGPARFVEIAEDVGLILPLGEWVLREACRQLQEWLPLMNDDLRQSNINLMGVPLYISVNLSARQFRQTDLASQVKRVLDEATLDARHLILEITESVVMEDAEQTIGTLRALKDLGVQLAIDDFGTGYSSLSYLRRFPVNILKIDRSFVSNLESSTEDNEIVRAIVSLGQTLGFRIVAEGIETREQWQRLNNLNCDSCQGYLFSPPVRADAALQFLQ